MRRHESANLAYDFHRAEHFFTLGMPHGTTWSYGEAFSMEGNVENNDDPDAKPADRNLIELGSIGIFEGSSGGAVFNQYGQVVGFVDSGEDDNPTQMFMISSKYVGQTLINFHNFQLKRSKRIHIHVCGTINYNV
jgi:hypothetical protein